MSGNRKALLVSLANMLQVEFGVAVKQYADESEAELQAEWTRIFKKGGPVALVPGSSGSTYEVLNAGSHWECSCPAFTFQKKRTEERTCKHLRLLRGDAVEEARVEAAAARHRPKPRRQRRPAPSEDDAPARRGSRIIDDEGREFEL